MRASRQGLARDLRADAQDRFGHADLSTVRRALDWFFRDRTTGAITIAQAPNAPLIVFAACALADWFIASEGVPGLLLRGLGALALAYWALDEVVRGVNPWRRCLGGVVLAGLAWNFALALA